MLTLRWSEKVKEGRYFDSLANSSNAASLLMFLFLTNGFDSHIFTFGPINGTSLKKMLFARIREVDIFPFLLR